MDNSNVLSQQNQSLAEGINEDEISLRKRRTLSHSPHSLESSVPVTTDGIALFLHRGFLALRRVERGLMRNSLKI